MFRRTNRTPRRIRQGRPSPALVVACTALFVALGGTAYAANTVRSSDIVNGQVKQADLAKNSVISSRVKNNSLLAADFKAGQLPAGPTGATGQQGPQGPGGPGGPGGPPGPSTPLADGSVTTLKLADNAVTSPKVADDSLTAGDLAANSVGAGELASNTVQGDEVEDGSLDGVDIGKASGSTVLNFPNIVAGACDFMDVAVAGAGATDQVTVSPEGDYNPVTFPVSIYGQSSPIAGNIRVVACNVSAAAVNVGATSFHYTVIDN